jgi:hypothetical protein
VTERGDPRSHRLRDEPFGRLGDALHKREQGEHRGQPQRYS